MMLTVNEPETCTAQAGSNDHDEWVLTGYYVSDFESRVNEGLDRLAALEPNWDAEGAPRIDPEIIRAAREFIHRLPKNIAPVPAVVPSAAGNLQFEWNAGPRSLELEIETPELIHYLKWDPARGVEEEDFFDISDVDRAVSLISWFMRGATHVDGR